MMSSVIPARLEFQCGHAALVTLPRVKGETSAQRNERVAREKSAARARQCDFCGPTVQIVVAAPAPSPVLVDHVPVTVAETLEVTLPVAAEPIVSAEPAVTVAQDTVTQDTETVTEPEPELVAEAPAVARTRRPRQQILTRLEPVARERRFVVKFRVERVLQATTIREAMRQAAALGATDILAIIRES
jgi:hypothetical protein